MERFSSIFVATMALFFLSACGDGGIKPLSKPGAPAGAGAGEYSFDPAPVAELKIKGALSDGTSSWSGQTVPTSPAVDAQLLARGRELYSQACAACHGEDGKGAGPLAAKVDFNSSPANLTAPLRAIKVRSTIPGTAPADEDLFRTLTRGMPGTAMLSFKNLPAEDRWALVHRIKELWTGRFSPAKVQPIPPRIPSDPELMTFGRQTFVMCQNCHGPDAMGGKSQASFNSTTGKLYPGIAFARAGGNFMLSGNSDEDLARTLLTGFSQTSPMMSFHSVFYGDEPNAGDIEKGNRKLWGTVHYTRLLIDAQNPK